MIPGLSTLRRYSSTAAIPKEFSQKLIDYFKAGDYLSLINSIDKSNFSNDSNLLKLKATSIECLMIEHQDNLRRTTKQIAYLEKKEKLTSSS